MQQDGLVIGRAFQAETVGLSPYIGPRLVLDAVRATGPEPGSLT